MKILFFGDSITDAIRPREHTYVDPFGSGYALFAIGDLLREDPHTVCVNRGISGNRVVDLYARIKIDCWNEQPDLISILVGVNEVLHEHAHKNGVELPRFRRVYEMMIEDTLEALPGVKIMLCEPFLLKRNDEESEEQRLEETKQYAAAVRAIAEKYGLPFVALQETIDEAAKRYGATAVLRDGVHPTAYGARLIADEWMKAYRSL